MLIACVVGYFLTGGVISGLADVPGFEDSPAMLGIWLFWPLYITTQLGRGVRYGAEHLIEAREERKAAKALPQARALKERR